MYVKLKSTTVFFVSSTVCLVKKVVRHLKAVHFARSRGLQPKRRNSVYSVTQSFSFAYFLNDFGDWFLWNILQNHI